MPVHEFPTLLVVLVVLVVGVGGAILAARFREPTHREMEEMGRRLEDRLQAVERKLDLLAERLEGRESGSDGRS